MEFRPLADLACPIFCAIVEKAEVTMRARTLIATIGYLFVGLIVLGLSLTIVTAARFGQPFYGDNAYGLPVGTYSTGAIMVIAGCIGVVRLIQVTRRRRN